MSDKPNHLLGQKSPYLIQHLYNPVDWYPWGEEAFGKALKENKPVFLSIGYSTCHWCHVMERESFEDPSVAEEMNRTFVCIKVDREERPDIDAAYMRISQMLTGTGGWPLNVILTPERKPIFALTYIPKESRRGMIGMIELCRQVRELWENGRDEIDSRVEEIMERVRSSNRTNPDLAVSERTVHSIFEQLRNNFDEEYGGFGMAPKFPTPHNLMFLLRYSQAYSNNEAAEMVRKTLDSMRTGGIWDHVGFGFHRYSTDANWVVPHFEKMLYDNALLMTAYAEAYASLKDPLYQRVVDEIFAFLKTELLSPEGAFYSALDADSEGEEGKYYTWKYGEIVDILGKDEAEKFCDLFNVSPQGNYSEEATGRSTSRNILYLSRDNLSNSSFDEFMSGCIRRLFEARKRRVRPHRDEKILTDINGLVIAALSAAHRYTGKKEYVDLAEKVASFLLTHMYRDGRLLHRYKDGEAAIRGFLDDYAFLSWGLIDLFLETSNPSYLETALALTKYTLEHFRGSSGSSLFLDDQTSSDVIISVREGHDGAIPSGNSVTCLNLVRLSAIIGDPSLKIEAEKIADDFGKEIQAVPMYHSFMGIAILAMVRKRFFVKTSKVEGNRGKQDALSRLYYNADFVCLRDEFAEAASNLLFVLRDKKGKNAKYQVCSDSECYPPLDSMDGVIRLLESA
ncbi:MAG TPA: thioredoxin domain-containing protein [Thermoplasmataceae archaeon]|nr:thioredoxin domain-containing protein [Thermoplasmataceae archaeon]